MRTIDISNLENLLPDGWEANAKALKDSLVDKTAEERRKIFKDNPIKIWFCTIYYCNF